MPLLFEISLWVQILNSFQVIIVLKDIVERLIKKEVEPVINESCFIQQNNALILFDIDVIVFPLIIYICIIQVDNPHIYHIIFTSSNESPCFEHTNSARHIFF